MSENITARVGRIITGSFHAIVNAVESAAPETVMEQAIREVDETSEQVRHELGTQTANKHLASKRLAIENEKHEKLAEQIEIAFSEDRHDLAEAVVSKQLDIEAQIPVLEQAIEEYSEKEKELEGYLLALAAKRREMVEELQAWRDARTAASTESSEPKAESKVEKWLNEQLTDAVGKVEKMFMRVAGEKAPETPGESPEKALSEATCLAELEELARRKRVNERLTKLKEDFDKSS